MLFYETYYISNMEELANTRNFSIIASVDAGKSSLSDNIMAMGGLIKEEDIGKKRETDTRDDEKERGITIKSTGVSVQFTLDQKKYHINVVDTPGHAAFNQNTQSAIRITDGALVLVDIIEGLQVQTKTVLSQALADRVRPVLVINKFDRIIFQTKMPPEEVYLRLLTIVNETNQFIEDYQTEENKWMQGNLSPVNGTVIFTSAYHNWGFDLPYLAKLYNPEKAEEMTKYMWGDYFVDQETGKFVTKGTEFYRVFCQLVYNPIKEMIEYLTNPDVPKKFRRHFKRLGYNIEANETETRGEDLYKKVFKKMFHLGNTLRRVIAHKLPNPIEAQKYRADILYSGPLDENDEVYRSIKNCDANGPLMFYVTLMVPTGEGGRFYAFGRIFSGTLKAGQKVTILDAGYQYGDKKDKFQNKSIQRVVQFVATKTSNVDNVIAGNIAAIQGIDGFMSKSGTVTSLEDAYPIKTIKFTVSPVVERSVRAKNSSEIQKLIEGLKRLSKSDPVVKIITSESGESIICATEDLHMEICIKDLRDFSKIELVMGEPVVSFRETVSNASDTVCLAKSKNKHNRIYLTAEPLDENLVNELESGELTMKNPKKFAEVLVKKYGWDANTAKKVMAIGPEGSNGSNLIVDYTVASQDMVEIRDSIVAGFLEGCLEGVLAKEKLRGVKFNVMDVMAHRDKVHCGADQISPMTQRAMKACQLSCNPTLYEPLYKVSISVPKSIVGTIYSCLSYKKGSVTNEESDPNNPRTNIVGNIPVLESFGFSAYMNEETSGQAFTQLSFDKWEYMRKDVVDQNIKKTRLRKGLKEEIPPLTDYLDKL